jgi:hypothetical protein
MTLLYTNRLYPLSNSDTVNRSAIFDKCVLGAESLTKF